MLTIREALGGNWATNLVAWAVLFVPATLLVILQESSTPFPSFSIVLGSAIAQHVLGAAAAALVAIVVRRRRPIIPVPASVFIWAIIGATRGAVAGLFAQVFTTADPEYSYRIVSWIAITVIWMPLFTYAIAQFARRNELLGDLGDVTHRLAAQREVAGLSAAELQSKLIATVQQAVGPVLDDIRHSLLEISQGLPGSSLSSIRFRLALVSRDAARIVDSDPEDAELVRDKSHRVALFAAAADFDQSRPIWVSLLTGVTLAPLLIPDSIRVGGPALGAETLVALLVSMVVMAGTLSAVRWWRNRSSAHLIAIATIGFLISGSVGSFTLLLLPWSDITTREFVLILVFPFGVVFAMACVSAAVGIALANSEIVEKMAEAQRESARLHKQSEATVNRVTKQLNELMHGPIQGRLAACAMALNFHATSPNADDPAKTAAVTESVLKHLERASNDLNELSKQ